MLSKKPTTAIILDTRRIKKENTYPVKIRVTFERQQKYYATIYSLTEKEFERALQGERLSSQEKEIKWKLQAYETKAADIIKNMSLFTWQKFENEYLSNRVKKGTIDQAFKEYAAKLRSEQRIGTAVSYECAANSLSKFSEKAKFTDITVDFLRKYEKWMIDKGNSVTTIGIYLRSLRALFNNAIADGDLHKDFYPFGKRKYEIPSSQNKKKALTIADISLIYNYRPEPGSTAEAARDYWLFMYLTNGINMKDVSLLKYKNIKGDFIEFQRAKTVRTKRKVEPIRVPITDDIRVIIKKHGKKRHDPDNYIFSILTTGISPEREYQLIQQITALVNDHIRLIAGELKIEGDVTTYSARHSFATILKRSGISTEFISEALGHSNTKTTQSYLASFEDETRLEAVKKLTAFNTK